MNWVFAARSFKVYDDFRSRNFIYEVIPFAKAVLSEAIGLIVILFILKYNVSRIVIVYFVLLLGITGISQKFIVRKVLNYLRRKGRNQRNMLIIGAGDVGKQFYDTVMDNPHFGYNIHGFLDDKRPEWIDGEYRGPISELNKILTETQIDNVIIALPNYAYGKLEEVINVCERYTTRVKIIPDYFKFSSSKYNVTMFGKFPMFSIREDTINEIHWRLLKRLFDIVFSSIVFIVLLSWMIPLIGLIIKLTSPGPIFFKQERWGRDNHKFFTYKFRSMANNCKEIDENGNFIQATKNDPRITKIGKFLRRTNFDELPQFINVILGNMTIVGPRPHPTPLNIQSKKDIKQYMLRHLVKPGITGWAQVNGYRGETKDKKLMQKRVEYDLWYIENWTFWLDIQIIIQTVWHMIKGDPNAY
jgi:putative colanic acid biosynthesis UDP-glucose lipid carrier transferase